MKETREIQRKQNTSCGHGGFTREVGVEPRGNAKALSKSATSERGKNGIQKDEERLLERIVSSDNLNTAYQKVKPIKAATE